MKIINILPVLFLLPSVVLGATRGDSSARIGVSRETMAAARYPTVAGYVPAPAPSQTVVVSEDPAGCRDAYRNCMDQFCLLDESQGERCACSDNIENAKSKIKAVLDIQAQADKLFTEGVEREKLGAKANWIFAENTANTRVSSADFISWLSDGEEDEEEDVGEDVTLGSDLYKMAVKYCEKELNACGEKSEMESMLYSRMIIQDCKNYDAYLADQKANAESNKRIAESAVRKARLEVFDTTNKYNRGECLLAYRSCIADKGGCGSNFENCLDASLLKRRANACENILDQCMAVRDYVVKDWNEESKKILEDAALYAESKVGEICKAQTWNCLEETCSASNDGNVTDSMCLSDINIASGLCPVIKQCEEKIPGFQNSIADKLASFRISFCENDIDKCLQDKCGVDYTKPECLGKKPYEIASLCPQSMFAACKNVEQYDIIVQSAILQMDYQMFQGCVNYFGEQLGKVCGTDMSCLPTVASATAFTETPKTQDAITALKAKVVSDSDAAVEEFFKQFEQDKTVTACLDSQSGSAAKKVKGKTSLGDSVFNAAKMLARLSAENRNLRAMESKIAELSKAESLDKARETCLNTYRPETPKESKTNYSYIKTVSFEPDLRNCHVCRMQQVCETGGESKAAAALKAASGGLAAGASMGTMINAGWGTAIGGVVGAVGAGVLGGLSGGKEEFCQEIESCEDINY